MNITLDSPPTLGAPFRPASSRGAGQIQVWDVLDAVDTLQGLQMFGLGSQVFQILFSTMPRANLGWRESYKFLYLMGRVQPTQAEKIKQDLCHSTSHGQADKQVNHLRRFPSLILWKLIFPQGDTKSHSASKYPCSQPHWLSKFCKVQKKIFFWLCFQIMWFQVKCTDLVLLFES